MTFGSAFVTTHPEELLAAMGNLDRVGAVMAAANAARYQAVNAQAAVHEQFVTTLGSSARPYAATEAANAIAAS